MVVPATIPGAFPEQLPTSRHVAFLRGLPRWGGRAPFALDPSYLVPAVLSALIPVIAGAVAMLLMMVALYARLGPRRKAVDDAMRRAARAPASNWYHALASVALSFAAGTFVALASVGAAVLLDAFRDTTDVIRALVNNVSATGFAVVDTFLAFIYRLREVDLTDPQVIQLIATPKAAKSDIMVKAFDAMRQYSLARMPDVQPLRQALVKLLARINDGLNMVVAYSDVVYYVICGLLCLQIVAPVVHLAEEALFVRGSRKRWRVLLGLSYILLPVATVWLLLGVASAAGVAVGDACVVLHDYRRHILNATGTPLKVNPLIESGLVCIDPRQAALMTSGINDALKSLDAPVFAHISGVLFKGNASDLFDAARGSARALEDIIDCTTLVNLSGKLEHIVCGAGLSVARGLFELWVALLGLAIALTVAFFASTLGMRVAWAYYVWPLPVKKVDSLEGSIVAEDEEKGDDYLASPEAVAPDWDVEE